MIETIQTFAWFLEPLVIAVWCYAGYKLAIKPGNLWNRESK